MVALVVVVLMAVAVVVALDQSEVDPVVGASSEIALAGWHLRRPCERKS